MKASKVKMALDEVNLGGVTVFENGTVHRRDPTIVVSHSKGVFIDGVATMDIVIPADVPVPARVFVPQVINDNIQKSNSNKFHDMQKQHLPVVMFMHGGGFVIGSPAAQMRHEYCTWMAARTKAVWVSLYYRLGPEDRLPAAVEDCEAAVEWLGRAHTNKEIFQSNDKGLQFLTNYADFSRCAVVGVSSGSHLAYLASISWAKKRYTVEKDPVKATVLLYPGILKAEQTRSEIEKCNAGISMELILSLMSLGVPEGEGRGYFVVDPPVVHVKDVRLPPLLLVGGCEDLFSDNHDVFCCALIESGQEVERFDFPNTGHFPDNTPDGSEQRCRVADYIVLKLAKE